MHAKFQFTSFDVGAIVAPAAAVWLACMSASSACSLYFTSPERGIAVTSAQIGVSGTGSGNAKPNDVGHVTATINGRVFFQQSNIFTALINFLGSGAASVTLEPGENTLAVQGSVSGCSAGDSMTIHYVPPLLQEQKAAGAPVDCNGTNPVNGGNGNNQEEVDYKSGGPHPLTFTRFHNSRYGERRMLGPRWRHTYDRQLAFSGGGHAYIIRPDGRAFHFTLTGSAWAPDVDVNHRLLPLRDSHGVVTGWRLDVGDVKDPLNRLTITRRRVYDALNRLHQSIGAY